MAGRAYDMRRRVGAVAAARKHALDAAYELLRDPACRDLGVEAVARAAGVTRVTLYNQFGSRAALLVAVFQDLGRRMKAERIHAAMRLTEPEQALCATLRESTRAYARQRPVIRKLFAIAVLDAEVSAEVLRSERQRRKSLAPLAARLVESGEIGLGVAAATALLASLTSFQAFEAFAADSGPRLCERRLISLVRAGLGAKRKKGRPR
ncbi:MAG TPA: helix-turn-helix domain-containing protein [Polyangiaceae bacterium]|nr:helix-turn-helix domain-containing protein [Polyangiaceae bacterium]